MSCGTEKCHEPGWMDTPWGHSAWVSVLSVMCTHDVILQNARSEPKRQMHRAGGRGGGKSNFQALGRELEGFMVVVSLELKLVGKVEDTEGGT